MECMPDGGWRGRMPLCYAIPSRRVPGATQKILPAHPWRGSHPGQLLRSIWPSGNRPVSTSELEAAGRMKLPNAQVAIVEQEKVVSYLLDPTHRYGASKARFFAGFGFRLDAWEVLARALREHARQHKVSAS